jgi:hypothetical protein
MSILGRLVTDGILGPVEIDTESNPCLEPSLNPAESTESCVPSDIIRLVGEDAIG